MDSGQRLANKPFGDSSLTDVGIFLTRRPWCEKPIHLGKADVAVVQAEPAGLEESRTQIETVRRYDQRDRQTNSAKYGNHLKDFDVRYLGVI